MRDFGRLFIDLISLLLTLWNLRRLKSWDKTGSMYYFQTLIRYPISSKAQCENSRVNVDLQDDIGRLTLARMFECYRYVGVLFFAVWIEKYKINLILRQTLFCCYFIWSIEAPKPIETIDTTSALRFSYPASGYWIYSKVTWAMFVFFR